MSKNLFEQNIDSGNPIEVREIIDSLWVKYPEVARELIEQAHNLEDERNKRFYEEPDNPEEHSPEWHQWGVITHTKMFEKAYREEIPQYLRLWGLEDEVGEGLSEEIDGMSKRDLLNIAIVFHDVGKFTARKLKEKEDGSVSASFGSHEVESGKIIRSEEISEMLKEEYDLTDAQIEYVARCAELHFELGVVRNAAKESELGYTIAFSQSEQFREEVEEIVSQHPDFVTEIGLLFLADSLAKTDIRINVETDEAIDQADEDIRGLLEKRELNPQLAKAVKQVPVNMSIAKEYLRLSAGDDL